MDISKIHQRKIDAVKVYSERIARNNEKIQKLSEDNLLCLNLLAESIIPVESENTTRYDKELASDNWKKYYKQRMEKRNAPYKNK